MSVAKKTNHFLLIVVVLPMVLVLLFVLNISLGSVKIPLSDILEILSGGAGERATWSNIIWDFRVPKAITAVLAGAALSISGMKMQTFFRNPLAGPFVLGISSGASLGVAILILASAMLGSFLSDFATNSWLVVLAATSGSALVLLLVVLVSIRVRDSMTILIIGLMFGSATGAIVGILQFFSNSEQIQMYLIWTFGSLGGVSWSELKVFMSMVGIGLVVVITMIKPLNALLLGENYARSMGINLKSTRILIVVITSLLAGSTTAFCGPIAFIGIAVPHLVRLLIDTSDHKKLIPAIALGGAIILLFCDTLAQLPGSHHVIPINAVTSLVGAPVVVWVILRKKNFGRTFG